MSTWNMVKYRTKSKWSLIRMDSTIKGGLKMERYRDHCIQLIHSNVQI